MKMCVCSVLYPNHTRGSRGGECTLLRKVLCGVLRTPQYFCTLPPKGGGQGPRPESEISSRVIAAGAFSKWVGEALGGAPFKITGGPHNRGPRF